MNVTVYRYGVPTRLVRGDATDPDGIPAELDSQLRLAHDLRTALVESELRYQEAVRAVWSSRPEIADVESLIGELEELARQEARERREARAEVENLAAGSKAALAGLQTARARRRALIAVAKAEMQSDLDAVKSQAQAAVRDLYRDFVQTRGLYWATFNEVVGHHRVGARRVASCRNEGQSARLRTRRWDGSGSIAVQLGRRLEAPARTPATIASATGRWRNVLTIPWVDPNDWDALSRAGRRRTGRGQVKFRIATTRWLTLPIVQHRMLPANADVTGARLVVTRRGGHRKVELHVTARIPELQPRQTGAVLALHTGSPAATCGDTIRCATWRSTLPIGTLPAYLNDVLSMDTERTGTLLLPGRLVSRARAHERIHRQRGNALHALRTRLVQWLEENGPVPLGRGDDGRMHELRSDEVRSWQSPARFAALARRWREQSPGGAAEIAADLETWRVADRALWEGEAHGRAGLIDAREDAYRRAVAWLLDGARRLVVDDLPPSERQTRPGAGALSGERTVHREDAARQRKLVAAGRLRQLAVTSAAVRGVEVVEVPYATTRWTHYGCGTCSEANDAATAARIVTCDGCGQRYDRDASATLVLLAASGDAPPTRI